MFRHRIFFIFFILILFNACQKHIPRPFNKAFKSNDGTKTTLFQNQNIYLEERKRKALEQKLVSLEKEKQKRIKEQRKRKELEKKLAALQSEKKKQIKNAKKNKIGSGFYVSKFRHIVTNQHVVNNCKKITVGDSMSTQIPGT